VTVLRVAENAARSDTGRQRPANEDSYWARRPLFVVADGMGGAQAGEVASRTAVEIFEQGLPDGPGSNEERLAKLVADANARIHALAQSDEQHAGMGTTLTAAYLGEDDLAVAHVGDSRLYLLRDGQLRQLTDDHSLVGELVRRGQLSAEEAEDHPQRSIITRALGPEGDVAVDHHTWPVRDGDVVLLCSDGLTSMVSDQQIVSLIDGAASLSEASARLVQAANEAGGRDNITVILFRVEEVTPAAAGGATAAHTAAAAAQATPPESEAPQAEEVRQATATAPPTAEERAAARAADPQAKPATTALPRVPRPPREGAPAAEPKRRRRWTGPLKGVLVLLVLLGIVGSGAWIASRSVYFVGSDADGFVTLYQGLPYELPAGLDLYQEQFTSGVPVQTLPARVRRTVTDHKLRSHDDAVDLVRQLERGDLAGQ
jgi:PPM family protein phosphatase